MLGLLSRYAYDHCLVTEPGFAPKTVRWAIDFDSHGNFLGVITLGNTENGRSRGRTFARCPELQQQELVRGSETRSHFLIETAQVVALVFKNEEDERESGAKTQGKRDYFIRLLSEASSSMPELAAIAQALGSPEVLEQIRSQLISNRARPDDNVTIAIDHEFPIESDAWHSWWREFRRCLQTNNDQSGPMMCFVTGEVVAATPTHPKIKGLVNVGGLATGDALVCFDKEAFRSYGFEQGDNCAVSEDQAYAYRAALNHLLSECGPPMAGAKTVHWYKERVPVEDDPLSWLQSPSREAEEASAAERANDLLAAIRDGRRPDLADNQYYALTVSGAAGRVMVRDWMDGRFEDLVQSVGKWFSDLEIVNLRGTNLASDPSMERIVTSLLLPKSNKQNYLDWVRPIQPQARAIWRAALCQLPIPSAALAKAVLLHTRFVQTGQMSEVMNKQDADNNNRGQLVSLVHARMGLMKAYHIRKRGEDCQLTAYLNEEHPSPAYQCGRIMAMLAQLQRRAQGNVGADVIQRYYAAASSTPGIVLGRLVRLSQFHLGKLEPGLARWYENRIAEVWSRIRDNIPLTLSLEDQSLFALGYYHQIASDNARANAPGQTNENQNETLEEDNNA